MSHLHGSGRRSSFARRIRRGAHAALPQWLLAIALLFCGTQLATAQAPPANAGTQGIGSGSGDASKTGIASPTLGSIGSTSGSPLPENVAPAPAVSAPAGNTTSSGGNAAANEPGASSPDYFITIGPDGNFLKGCETFYPTGWNQFEVVESGAGVPKLYSASIPPGKTGPQLIRDLMAKAVKNNFNTIRFFAFGVSPQYTLQNKGVFNEDVFRGLDYALDTARRYGIKAILPLVNNWNLTGGTDEMLAWNGLTEHELFFSDPTTMQTYRNTVKTIITRVNTINGRLYSEDPTILAWNLINEPRCFRCGDGLLTWVRTMSAYVKSLDNNHLLGIGEEGFYPKGSPGEVADPLGLKTWAGFEGQNFLRDTAVANIDYGTMHLWVDNWKDESPSFPMTWMQQHIRDAETLNKPLLLQEFGKFESGRQGLYQKVYDMVYKSASTGGPLKGASFWQWYDQGQMVPGGGVGDYGMLDTDPVFSQIIDNAGQMSKLSRKVTGCKAPTAVGAPPTCSNTWVDNVPGTGYEGPACDVDINECVRGTASCALNAGCINSPGGFNCTCNFGYSGDGKSSCKENAKLAALKKKYTPSAKGTLACRQGDDVIYPAGSPGFAYDPTGAFKSLDGFGSLMPVSMEGCQQACEAAPAGAPCDSISYNPTLESCFLKSGGSATDCDAATVACAATDTTGIESAACTDWMTYRRDSPAGTAVSRTRRPTLAAPAPEAAPDNTPPTPGRLPPTTGQFPLPAQGGGIGASPSNPFTVPQFNSGGNQLADSAGPPLL